MVKLFFNPHARMRHWLATAPGHVERAGSGGALHRETSTHGADSLAFRKRGSRIGATGMVLAALALAPAGCAVAADFDPLFAGTDDFGDVGLLQTPTARMRQEGEFGLGVSTVRPYNQIHFFLQPLPWLELAARYTDVTNRPYSTDPSFSGDQHYKDKSADLKLRLLDEGQYRPSIAVGLQDLGGTGLFSSEYLVSSYHWYDFDFSFGLGWGRLGSAGGIYNPFRVLSSHFDKSHYNNSTSAGGVGAGRLFTGSTIGPFGGVEWNTPLPGLALRLEYDGNDYQHEGLGDDQHQSSPLNVGLAYRGIKGLDFGVGFERGNLVTARFAIYTNLQTLRGVAKTADPGLPPLPKNPPPPDPQAPAATATATAAATAAASAPPAATPGADEEQRNAFVLQLRQALKEQGFTFIAADYDSYSAEVRLWLSQNKYRNPDKAVGRTARVLCATAPAEISKFTLVFVDAGVENYRAEVYRDSFERAARQNDLDQALNAIVLRGPGDGYNGAQYYDATRLPQFSWSTGPAIRQSVGSPGTFYAGQLYWKLSAGLQITDHLNLSGAAGFNIVNNFSDLRNEPESSLPHVRSDIVRYLQDGKDGLIRLAADYAWSPYPDWYHRLSAGIFEEMYGGVATELLYRPYGSSWAVAVDVNRVKKRGYGETFDFLPYTVTTGHATLYYKPGFYNLLIKLSGGQYLAGDRGGTIDISRQFDSGVTVGVFATKTNVSAAQFGEGSFDKGVYISLPLDLFFASSTRREAGFTFRPLTRDGGQMVYDGPELYYSLRDGQPDGFARQAAEIFK